MQKHINVECKYVIFLGDMNTMRDAILDNVSGGPHDPKVIESFNKAVEALELTDIWKFLIHGNEKCFSWKRTQPFIARRLDYILISEMCVVNTKSCEIVPYLKSDHDLIILTLQNSNIVKGQGYWKFNNALLKDIEYMNLINRVINETIHMYQPASNPQELWDICKSQIKNSTICYSHKKAREQREKEKQLRRRFEEIRKLINQSNVVKEALLEEYDKIALKMELDEEIKFEGARIRSKQQWTEFGEKPTRLFLSLEKSRACKREIHSLVKFIIL